MKKDPSNIVLQVVIGIALLFAAYVIGGFLIKTRREVKETPEASLIIIYACTRVGTVSDAVT